MYSLYEGLHRQVEEDFVTAPLVPHVDAEGNTGPLTVEQVAGDAVAALSPEDMLHAISEAADRLPPSGAPPRETLTDLLTSATPDDETWQTKARGVLAKQVAARVLIVEDMTELATAHQASWTIWSRQFSN